MHRTHDVGWASHGGDATHDGVGAAVKVLVMIDAIDGQGLLLALKP